MATERFDMPWTATRDGKTRFFFRPETIGLLIKVLMAMKMSDLLQREEVDGLVPTVDECQWLTDM